MTDNDRQVRPAPRAADDAVLGQRDRDGKAGWKLPEREPVAGRLLEAGGGLLLAVRDGLLLEARAGSGRGAGAAR